MIKQEYKQRMAHANVNADIADAMMAMQEYIESLEAENAALTLLHTQATDEMLKMQNRVHKLEAEIAQLKKDKLEFNAQCFHKDETISVLKNRIAELWKQAVVWHKYPDEKPQIDGRHLFWDSDGNAPHVLPYNDIVVRDNPGVFSTQTHWAYLPSPPKEKEK